jgi:hypothetical protein
MTKKTYFKGKKGAVKPKKYAFAGFDESTMDNSQMLNALYNPKYYESQENSAAQNQAAANAIESQKAMSSDVTKNVETAKLDYENYTKALADQQKQVQDQQKQMQEASKKQDELNLYSNLAGIGKDLGSQITKLATAKAAEKAAAKTKAAKTDKKEKTSAAH